MFDKDKPHWQKSIEHRHRNNFQNGNMMPFQRQNYQWDFERYTLRGL